MKKLFLVLVFISSYKYSWSMNQQYPMLEYHPIPMIEYPDIITAAKNGNQALVADFLQKDIPAKQLGSALIMATIQGYDNIVKLILTKKPKSIDLANIVDALLFAAHHNYIKIVKLILTKKNQKISEKDKGLAFIFAAHRGNSSIANYIAAKYVIPIKSLGLGCEAAAAKGFRKLVQGIIEMLQSQKVPAEKNTEKPVIIPDEYLKKVISAILINGTQEDIGWALTLAVSSNFFEFVKYILQTKQEIALTDLGMALKTTQIHNNSLGMIQLILSERPNLPKQYIGETLVLASQKKHWDIIEKLLVYPGILIQYWAEVVANASIDKQWELVTKILANQPNIPEKYMGEVVANASNDKQWKLVTILLNKYPNIPAQYKGKIIAHASKCEKWDLVKKLLKYPNIQPQNIATTLYNICNNKNTFYEQNDLIDTIITTRQDISKNCIKILRNNNNNNNNNNKAVALLIDIFFLNTIIKKNISGPNLKNIKEAFIWFIQKNIKTDKDLKNKLKKKFPMNQPLWNYNQQLYTYCFEFYLELVKPRKNITKIPNDNTYQNFGFSMSAREFAQKNRYNKLNFMLQQAAIDNLFKKNNNNLKEKNNKTVDIFSKIITTPNQEKNSEKKKKVQKKNFMDLSIFFNKNT